MAKMKRRDFLKSGSVALTAVGLASAVPGGAMALSSLGEDAPEVDTSAAATSDAVGPMSEPIVARVNDLASGEMQLFFGTQELTYKDPQTGCPTLPGHPEVARYPHSLSRTTLNPNNSKRGTPCHLTVKHPKSPRIP